MQTADARAAPARPRPTPALATDADYALAARPDPERTLWRYEAIGGQTSESRARQWATKRPERRPAPDPTLVMPIPLIV